MGVYIVMPTNPEEFGIFASQLIKSEYLIKNRMNKNVKLEKWQVAQKRKEKSLSDEQ